MYGANVRLETTFNLVVEFDGLHTAYIELPSNGEFNGNIQGMCGNYDGDPDTDYIDRDGNDHFDHPNTDNKLGNGWKCQKNKEVHR